MKYFGDLRFVCWGDAEGSTAWHDRVFTDYYGLQYNHAGSLTFARGEEERRVYSGPQVFLSQPGIRFQYGVWPGQSPRHHMFVCFQGPRVERFIASGLLAAGELSALTSVLQSAAFYRQLLELQQSLEAGAGRLAQAVHQLEGLLLLLHEQGQLRRRPGRFAGEFEQLSLALGQHADRSWDFRAEAERLNLSYPHFRRLFEQHCGLPPGQYLQHCRLEFGARLLRGSDEKIARIAELAGFGDVYYFTRLFRRRFRLPPAKYRQEFQLS